MTIGERIKLLRKELGLNQSQFADKIGLKQAAIGLYENNQRGVADHIRLLICEKYNVNEKWLSTGEGEMFTKTDSTVIAQLTAEYGLDAFEKDLIEGFLKLRPEERKVIKSYVSNLKKSLLSATQENSQPLQQPCLTVVESPTQSERAEWERQADEFAAMARAQFLQEKKRESQASSAPQSDAG